MRHRILLVIASLIMSHLASVIPALACSCGPSIGFPPTWWLENSDYVAKGRVLLVQDGMIEYQVHAVFEVHALWKGSTQPIEVLVTDKSSCGVWFVEGEEYLVYLDEFDGTLYADACRRIQQGQWIEDDVALLPPPLVVPTGDSSFGMVKARHDPR